MHKVVEPSLSVSSCYALDKVPQHLPLHEKSSKLSSEVRAAVSLSSATLVEAWGQQLNRLSPKAAAAQT